VQPSYRRVPKRLGTGPPERRLDFRSGLLRKHIQALGLCPRFPPLPEIREEFGFISKRSLATAAYQFSKSLGSGHQGFRTRGRPIAVLCPAHRIGRADECPHYEPFVPVTDGDTALVRPSSVIHVAL